MTSQGAAAKGRLCMPMSMLSTTMALRKIPMSTHQRSTSEPVGQGISVPAFS